MSDRQGFRKAQKEQAAAEGFIAAARKRVAAERLADILPEDATACKLRTIANWLDIYEKIVVQHINLLERNGLTPESVDVEKALAAVRGDEVQRDLRRWADEIDTGENVTIPRSVVKDAVALARELGGPGYDEHEEWTWPIRDLARYVED